MIVLSLSEIEEKFAGTEPGIHVGGDIVGIL